MKLTKNEIEKRIKEKFPEYKFDIEDLKNTTTKIKLICPKHGEFEQTLKSLFNDTGCTKCSGKFHYTTKSFIEIAEQISQEYDYKFNKCFHKNLHEFHRQLHHDWLKRKYAKDKKIPIVYLNYWEDISKKLDLLF